MIPQNADSIIKKLDIYVESYVSIYAGWCPLLQNMLIELINAGWDKRLGQIKIKFGLLTVYLKDPKDHLNTIVRKYEHLSSTICAGCGSHAVQNKKIFISFCDECDESDIKWANSP